MLRATQEHVLGPVQSCFLEPRGIGSWYCLVVDDMAAFVAENRDVVPNEAPEEIDMLGRPSV